MEELQQCLHAILRHYINVEKYQAATSVWTLIQLLNVNHTHFMYSCFLRVKALTNPAINRMRCVRNSQKNRRCSFKVRDDTNKQIQQLAEEAGRGKRRIAINSTNILVKRFRTVCADDWYIFQCNNYCFRLFDYLLFLAILSVRPQ